jgi:ribulose-bisphosphate carboxylase small chain
MAAITAQCVAPVASATRVAKPAAKSSLKAVPFTAAREWQKKTVSNGIKTSAMMVWQPIDNKMFETFSYLPPLSDQEIARQVDYITANGWTPCLEFAPADQAYVSNENCIRFGAVTSLYYDNRYWTMWKLPMFGCTDPNQVLNEVNNCRRSFPDAYVRMAAFDSIKQVQITSFLVHRPPSARDWKPVDKRQV